MRDCGVIGMYEGGHGQIEEYCGIIQKIIKLGDFMSTITWFIDVMGNIPRSSISLHASGCTTISSTKHYKEGIFILPSQCEHVSIVHI